MPKTDFYNLFSCASLPKLNYCASADNFPARSLPFDFPNGFLFYNNSATLVVWSVGCSLIITKLVMHFEELNFNPTSYYSAHYIFAIGTTSDKLTGEPMFYVKNKS